MSYESYRTCSDSKLRELVLDRTPTASRDELIMMLQMSDVVLDRQYDEKNDGDLMELLSDRKLPVGNSRRVMLKTLLEADKPPKRSRDSETEEPPEDTTFKRGCVKIVDPRFARRRVDSWKMCDAIRRGGKPCNKWVVVSLEEFKDPDRKFRCSYCIKNNMPCE
jgi:hypothetical protein